MSIFGMGGGSFTINGTWLPFNIHDFVLIPEGTKYEERIDGEGTVHVKITPQAPIEEVRLKFKLDYGGGLLSKPKGYKMHEDS